MQLELMNAVAKPFVVERDRLAADARAQSITPSVRGSLEPVPDHRRQEGGRHEPHVLGARREGEGRDTALDPRAYDLAVGHEMQVGVERPRPADLFGPRGETLADEGEDGAVGDHRPAEIGVGPLELVQVGGKQAAHLLEGAAITHRKIALRRKVVGEEDVVAVELDMPVGDRLDFNPGDRPAVDQFTAGMNISPRRSTQTAWPADR